MILKGKVIVITGAGGGIGQELVVQALSDGAFVAAVDINPEALERTKAAAGENAHRLSLHVANITDSHAVCALPEDVLSVHGKIDAIINNAGIIQPFVPFAELDYETIQRVMNINVYGMMYMTRSFLPYIAEAEEGYIANVSSMGGFLPVPGQALYGASKAAVKLLTEALRSELVDTNIHVSVIMPGGVATDITKNSGVKISASAVEPSGGNYKMTTPKEAARTILVGIRSNKPRILVGKDAKFMDLLSRLAPVKASQYITRMMASLVQGNAKGSTGLKTAGCLDRGGEQA